MRNAPYWLRKNVMPMLRFLLVWAALSTLFYMVSAALNGGWSRAESIAAFAIGGAIVVVQAVQWLLDAWCHRLERRQEPNKVAT